MKDNRNKSRRRGAKRFDARNTRPDDGAANARARATPGRPSARQNLDKYMALAREAAASGDTVTSERYHQYAEHYRRQLNGLSD